jgi:divalent metal cation (Fe/Co/Zn/Cd) transporter
LISIRQAAQPPDRAHRYGHGKAEAIGAFVQAGFVLASGLIVGILLVRPEGPIPAEEEAQR